MKAFEISLRGETIYAGVEDGSSFVFITQLRDDRPRIDARSSRYGGDDKKLIEWYSGLMKESETVRVKLVEIDCEPELHPAVPAVKGPVKSIAEWSHKRLEKEYCSIKDQFVVSGVIEPFREMYEQNPLGFEIRNKDGVIFAGVRHYNRVVTLIFNIVPKREELFYSVTGMEEADYVRWMPKTEMGVGDEVEITFKRLDEITGPADRNNYGPLSSPDIVEAELKRLEMIENEMRKRGLEIK